MYLRALEISAKKDDLFRKLWKKLEGKLLCTVPVLPCGHPVKCMEWNSTDNPHKKFRMDAGFETFVP